MATFNDDGTGDADKAGDTLRRNVSAMGRFERKGEAKTGRGKGGEPASEEETRKTGRRSIDRG